MSPKNSCVKGLLFSVVSLTSGRIVRGWSLIKDFEVAVGYTWARLWEPSPFSFLSLCSQEMNNFLPLHTPAIMCCLTQSNRANWSWTDISRSRSEVKTFIFVSSLSPVFVIVTERWLTQTQTYLPQVLKKAQHLKYTCAYLCLITHYLLIHLL